MEAVITPDGHTVAGTRPCEIGTVAPVGGREYLGCVGVLAVAALLSGAGVAAVAGALLSLFVVPIVLIVGGAVAFVVYGARESRRR
jgi:hypothetical protein